MIKLVFAIAYFISKQHAAQLAPVIKEVGRQYRQDPYLISAVIQVESTFSRRACHKGAYGYMQVQTRYRKCTHRAWLNAWWQDLMSAKENIRRGTKLMAWWKRYCTKHHKGHHHWLLHYNQGFGKCPGKTRCKLHERIPITTGKIGGYANRVLRLYRILKSRARSAHTS